MQTVIVVAHPDDETIWAGGLATRLKCDIIACSIPKRDPIRAMKFYDACEILGCRGMILPVVENPPHLLDLSMLRLDKYDHIITHNEKGEYGHAHHSQLHHTIKSKYAYRKLSFFGWGVGGENINLTDEEYQKKLKALQCYDHDNGIDGAPKWQALINRYHLNLKEETHAIS